MRANTLAIAFVAGLCALAASNQADAFCRTTTCQNCPQPLNGCVTSGIPIFWAESCVGYDLQRDASAQVPLDTATQIAAQAFSHWQDVLCPDADTPPSIRFTDLGPVNCGRAEFNDPREPTPNQGGNANIIVFRDATWDHTNTYDPTSTLALTTVTYSAITGRIYDADIELNGQLPLDASGSPRPDAFDLESVLTHEVGHFLGLAHSNLPCDAECPAMHASYTRGSIASRTLKADDIAGICTIYPPDRTHTSDTCLPMGGHSSECGSAQPIVSPTNNGSGCAIAFSRQDSHADALPFVAVWAIIAPIALRNRRGSGSRLK